MCFLGKKHILQAFGNMWILCFYVIYNIIMQYVKNENCWKKCQIPKSLSYSQLFPGFKFWDTDLLRTYMYIYILVPIDKYYHL